MGETSAKKGLQPTFTLGENIEFAPTLLKGDEAQAVARSAPENLRKKKQFYRIMKTEKLGPRKNGYFSSFIKE